MNKKKVTEGRYLWLYFWFVTFLALLFFIWFSIKIIVLVSKSKFDFGNQYSIDFYNKSKNEILVLNNSKIFILNIENSNFNSIAQKLEIPIDEYIYSDFLVKKNNLSEISRQIFSNKEINLIDKYKLFYSFKRIGLANIYYFDLLNINKISKNLIKNIFTDNIIFQKEESVAIINATGQDGFANRLSEILSNIGCNIILISASPRTQNNSEIDYNGNQSYTLRRISKILDFKLKNNLSQNSMVADIVITIGKDQIDTNKF